MLTRAYMQISARGSARLLSLRDSWLFARAARGRRLAINHRPERGLSVQEVALNTVTRGYQADERNWRTVAR